ncbi:hypothetical protein PG984_007980 [Apiospora sp. TS-2023a]
MDPHNPQPEYPFGYRPPPPPPREPDWSPMNLYEIPNELTRPSAGPVANPDVDLWQRLTNLQGYWLWSHQNGFEVMHNGRLYSVNPDRRTIDWRRAQGQWVFDHPDKDVKTWIENGTQAIYESVEGPPALIQVNNGLLPIGCVGTDAEGQRLCLKADGTWTQYGGFDQAEVVVDTDTANAPRPNFAEEPPTPPKMNYINRIFLNWVKAGDPVPDGGEAAPGLVETERLRPIEAEDPTNLWLGMQTVLGADLAAPPLPEHIEGAVANPVLIPCKNGAEWGSASGSAKSSNRGGGSSSAKSSDRGASQSPDPRLSNLQWRLIDGWLGQAFPLNRFPAADSLDAKLAHVEAYMPLQKPPALTFSQTKAEASGVWVSVQTELLVSCANANSYAAQTVFEQGKLPLPVTPPWAISMASPHTSRGLRTGNPHCSR